MLQQRPLLTVAMLIASAVGYSSSCAQNSPPIRNLEDYLAEMGLKLGCYFTFEDRPNAEGSLPWIAYIKDFVPDLEVATIDALVTKLNQELDGVEVRRSTTYPSVVHLIAEDLLQPGYVMDATVTTQYAGELGALPDHLGTLLDGKIGQRTFGLISGRVLGDFKTSVEIDVQNRTVRDVLTGAVPLADYKGFLWESEPYQADGSLKTLVTYFGPRLKPEDLIVTLDDYLVYMGDKLNCYFTVEDRPTPEGDAFSWLLEFGAFRDDTDLSVDITTIDGLVTHLNEQLEGVQAVRSTKLPSVVHLIREDLLQPGYVMEDTVTIEYEGGLVWLPDHLGTLLSGRVRLGADVDGFPHFLIGGDTPNVDIAVENEKLRDALTGAVPLAGYERLLWLSVLTEVEGETRALVEYNGLPSDPPPDP